MDERRSSDRLSGRPSRRLLAGLPAALATLLFAACTSHFANRDCVGAAFPEVAGQALDGKDWNLPRDLAGAPAVVLIGYLQEAQFDADRWLFGLLQAKTPVRLIELPTIPGLFPRVAAGAIDGGMRAGIPSEDWQTVVTLYGQDATRVAEFTGNEGGRNIRVLLLDRDGKVVWSHARGFSAGKLLELDAAARSLSARDAAAPPR